MKALLAGILLLAAAAPLQAAPLFSDVGEVPARPAVENLSRQAVIEGYPDGTFKGDRAASRYELSQVMARIVNLEEKAHAGLASASELTELKGLEDRLRQPTESLEVRTQNLETEVDSLQKRVKRAGRNRIF